MAILNISTQKLNRNLRIFGNSKNEDAIEELSKYLLNNSMDFCLFVTKRFEFLMRDEKGELFDACDKNKERDISVECNNDPILIDGLLTIPAIEWVESQVI